MVWWFAAPVVLFGIKKIYDAVTDDSSSSDTDNYSRRISAQKGRRTKRRKELLSDLINANCKLLNTGVFEIVSCQMTGLGQINISHPENWIFDVSFPELDKALHHLNTIVVEFDCIESFLSKPLASNFCSKYQKQKNLPVTDESVEGALSDENEKLTGERIMLSDKGNVSYNSAKTRQVDRFAFDSLKLDLISIVKKADVKYGEMAGIGVSDEYIESEDPFVQDIKQQRNKLMPYGSRQGARRI